MSDTENKTINATAKRDFKDAGTERTFVAGKSYLLTEGEFHNFEFAGLVEATPVAASPVEGDGKPSRTRS